MVFELKQRYKHLNCKYNYYYLLGTTLEKFLRMCLCFAAVLRAPHIACPLVALSHASLH